MCSMQSVLIQAFFLLYMYEINVGKISVEDYASSNREE